jgi:hypothetical protein
MLYLERMFPVPENPGFAFGYAEASDRGHSPFWAKVRGEIYRKASGTRGAADIPAESLRRRVGWKLG